MMFEWKVEEMSLLNQKSGLFLKAGKEKIYDCEHKVSREDKITFVDSMQDGKLSYILDLIEKFQADKDTLPQVEYWNGRKVKTVSLKAWLTRNDTKSLIDKSYHYGEFKFFKCIRNIQTDTIGPYDIYDDLVDEVFHRQLQECEALEKQYFLEHDEYSVLKTKVRDYNNKYNTSFGVNVSFCSDGKVYIYKDDSWEEKREITMAELKQLIYKYEQLEAFIEDLTEEIKITY